MIIEFLYLFKKSYIIKIKSAVVGPKCTSEFIVIVKLDSDGIKATLFRAY